MISVEYTITDLNQLIYNFAFDYLKKKYIKVSSKNITTGVVTKYTYGVDYVVVDSTIELLHTVGAVGDVLRIVRETSTSEQIVSWNDASILKASDMSLAQLQQLHTLEEYSEYMSTSSLALDINGQYDANNSRIVNLSDPQTATDAVNRGYIDSFIGTLTDAQTSATLAQSWAIGDILNRPEGSSKYWAEQANIITNGDLWLKKDGSRPLDPTYYPTVPQAVATKDYVDRQLNPSFELPPISLFVSSATALSFTKPTVDVVVPYALVGTGSVSQSMTYIYPQEGYVPANGRYNMEFYFENLTVPPNTIYTVTLTLVVKGITIFTKADSFVVDLNSKNFQMFINTLNIVDDVPYVVGDTGTLTITISKNTGTTSTINLVSRVATNKFTVFNRLNTQVYTTAVLDYNGIDTKTQRDRNIEFDTYRYTGIENNIISGRKVSGVSNFTLGLTAGANWINSRRYDRLANDITLSPRSVNLVYDKNDGTTGSVPAVYPIDMIDNNTVGFWIFNQEGNIPNSAVGLSSIAVANDLVPSGGITSVDGWCDFSSKLDGTSGYYVSQNSTGIPIGASVREFTLMFTVNAINGTNNHLLSIGGTSGTTGFRTYLSSAGDLIVNNGGTEYPTCYTVTTGQTYKMDFKLTGTTIDVYVNGVLIYTGAFVVNTTETNLYIGRLIAGSYFAPVTLHYLEVRNALRSDKQTAQIANKLLLPCFYTSGYPSNTDITTSANAISSSDNGGYVKGNAFDKTVSTQWRAGEITANQSGVSYIGNLFWKAVKIAKATIQQYSGAGNCLTSAKLQYTTDNGASWVTIDTYTLAQNETVQEFSFTPITCNGMRWLANSNVASNVAWIVREVTFVTDSSSSIRESITEILPANSVSLGIVKANSTGVTAYNDTDYMYGRREGAYGGNRRVFLGWKAFSGAVYLSWDNPFGTRKVKLQAVWAQDTNGMNESDLLPHYWNNGDAGGYTGTDVTPSDRITVRLFNGAGFLNGVRLTSGFIGVYAEVLE